MDKPNTSSSHKGSIPKNKNSLYRKELSASELLKLKNDKEIKKREWKDFLYKKHDQKKSGSLHKHNITHNPFYAKTTYSHTHSLKNFFPQNLKKSDKKQPNNKTPSQKSVKNVSSITNLNQRVESYIPNDFSQSLQDLGKISQDTQEFHKRKGQTQSTVVSPIKKSVSPDRKVHKKILDTTSNPIRILEGFINKKIKEKNHDKNLNNGRTKNDSYASNKSFQQLSNIFCNNTKYHQSSISLGTNAIKKNLNQSNYHKKADNLLEKSLLSNKDIILKNLIDNTIMTGLAPNHYQNQNTQKDKIHTSFPNNIWKNFINKPLSEKSSLGFNSNSGVLKHNRDITSPNESLMKSGSKHCYNLPTDEDSIAGSWVMEDAPNKKLLQMIDGYFLSKSMARSQNQKNTCCYSMNGKLQEKPGDIDNIAGGYFDYYNVKELKDLIQFQKTEKERFVKDINNFIQDGLKVMKSKANNFSKNEDYGYQQKIGSPVRNSNGSYENHLQNSNIFLQLKTNPQIQAKKSYPYDLKCSFNKRSKSEKTSVRSYLNNYLNNNSLDQNEQNLNIHDVSSFNRNNNKCKENINQNETYLSRYKKATNLVSNNRYVEYRKWKYPNYYVNQNKYRLKQVCMKSHRYTPTYYSNQISGEFMKKTPKIIGKSNKEKRLVSDNSSFIDITECRQENLKRKPEMVDSDKIDTISIMDELRIDEFDYTLSNKSSHKNVLTKKPILLNSNNNHTTKSSVFSRKAEMTFGDDAQQKGGLTKSESYQI